MWRSTTSAILACNKREKGNKITYQVQEKSDETINTTNTITIKRIWLTSVGSEKDQFIYHDDHDHNTLQSSFHLWRINRLILL